MRMIFISDTEKTPYSGMGRWTYSVARELREAGSFVEEWYGSEVGIGSPWNKLRVVAVPLKVAWLLWGARREYDFAMIHEPLAWPSALLARIFPAKMPKIVTVSHGIESRGKREFQKAQKLGLYSYPALAQIKHKLFTTWQSDLGLRLSNWTICMNSSDRRYLLEELGVPNDHVIQINNGIAPASDLPDLSQRAKPSRTVLFLSHWRDYKGRRLLPQMWDEVRANCPDAKLFLVGTSTQEEQVRSSFSEEAQSSITVMPSIHDRKEMQRVLMEAGIFLMPSIFEGSPLAMIEAMACGLAIVGSNAGGIPDLLGDGEYGVIFPWSAPMKGARLLIEFLQDDQKRAEFAHKARLRAESLTWTATAMQILVALKAI